MKKLLISELLMCLPALGMIFTGCSKDDVGGGNLSDEITTIKVNGLIGNEIPKSRAHWSEQNGSLLFHWDSSTDEMKAAVAGTSGLKAFVGDSKISGINVAPKSGSENRLKASLVVQDKLSVNYEEGDKFYAFSPVKDGISSVSADENVVFNMSIPLQQQQSLSDNTAHISQYAYMVGEGNVSVSGNYASTEIGFNVLPTLFCFNVTNASFDNLEIKSISMEGNINNSAVLTIGASPAVQYSGAENPQKFEVTADGVSVNKDGSAVIYALAFPSTIETGSTIKFGFSGVYDGGKSYNIEKTITLDEQMKFESNRFQKFNMNISVTGIDVSWDVTSWGEMIPTDVTGTSDTVGTQDNTVGNWNSIEEKDVTANVTPENENN